MKLFYAFQLIDLRYQVDHITTKKNHFSDKNNKDPNNARRFVIFFTQREHMTISDGNKVSEKKVI